MFSRGAGTPFVVDAASFLIGSVLIIGLPLRSVAAVEPGPAARARVRDGLAMLWSDGVLRILALCILIMNSTLFATTAVLVLVARDRLGLGPEGYGLLLATLAGGGLAGTAIVNRLLDRFGPVKLLSIGLLLEAGTHLGLALTHSPWVAGAVLFVFGVHSAVWSVLTLSLRQQRVSDDARGRVTSAYQVLSTGGAAIGALLGGVLVRIGGLTTPMWVGAAVVAVLFIVSVPTLRRGTLEPVR